MTALAGNGGLGSRRCGISEGKVALQTEVGLLGGSEIVRLQRIPQIPVVGSGQGVIGCGLTDREQQTQGQVLGRRRLDGHGR